ncbi:MAG: histidine kinase dimerization/phospho-acceptor domain-containing protein, partial [Spirochaetales bacterium]
MFKKTRRRIFLSIMGSLSLLFIVTLSVILFASFRQMQRENQDKLKRYSDMYLLESQKNSEDAPSFEPPAPPQDRGRVPETGPMDNSPDFQLSVFYSVAFSKEGEVLEVNVGEKKLYEEEALVNLAKEARANNKKDGKKGDLVYLVSEKPGYILVAFLDNTMANSNLDMLIRNFIIVGLVAILILLVISYIIAGRIVRPLEENDRKQKQFISDASHELKTPVSVINANTEMLRR